MARKYKRSGLPGLLKLEGYALPCGVSCCTKFLVFFHHQHGTSVPSNTYNCWGCRSSFGLGGGSTTSRVPEYSVNRSGDSGLGRAKNIG